MCPYVYCSIIYNSQVIIDDWIKMMYNIYIQLNISHKKKTEILPFAKACLDLECIMLSEISQKEKV